MQQSTHQFKGGAADIVMMAMLKVENDERLKRLGYKMLLQIHDGWNVVNE